VLSIDYYTYGLLTPGLSYALSCLGAFAGLRCTSRARALQGAARTRWLLLGGASIGVAGVWVAHFVAMLGATIPAVVIRYNVPVTMVSLLVAAASVCAGLLIADSARGRYRPLILAGLTTGLGVAGMHDLGMAALRMPGRLSYSPALFMVSVALAVVAATMVLWAALRLRGAWSTLIASLVIAVAVVGMDYSGLAAARVLRAPGPAGMVMGGAGGATAVGFLLPLIVGLAVVSFLLSAAVAWSPTEDEINYDAALLAHVRSRSAGPPCTRTAPLPPLTIGRSGFRTVGSPALGRGGAGNGAADSRAADSAAAADGAAGHGVSVKGRPPWVILSEFRRPPEPR
jgi:NO-binding membrane sensor protein with MHYT domain